MWLSEADLGLVMRFVNRPEAWRLEASCLVRSMKCHLDGPTTTRFGAQSKLKTWTFQVEGSLPELPEQESASLLPSLITASSESYAGPSFESF